MRRSSNGFGTRTRKDPERAALMGPIPPGYNAPTSFRIAREEDLEDSSTRSIQSGTDSTFGVRSLQDTIYGLSPTLTDLKQDNKDYDEDDCGTRRRSTLKPISQPHTRESSPNDSGRAALNTTDSSPARPAQGGPSPPSMSQSMISLSLDSQAPLSSLPSTPKSTSNRSFRPSDEESVDEGGSQAIVSSEDDEADPPPETHDSVPQLIMPSIKMPSRRPFTERGKAMGRLKVLLAGDSGVGKTSLIKSIVQTCEDIVHVDPLSPSLPLVDRSSSRKGDPQRESPNTKGMQDITEVYASTKPYPSWWSDVEDTKLLRRRKSMDDTVLERNICFVDTPGYSNGISRMEGIQSVLQYIEAQLTKPFSAPTASEGDIVGLLSGNGGSQVDLVFYLITQGLKDEDIVFLQSLTAVTNVIPLIAHSDTQSFEETEMLRRSIDKLQQSGIRLFTFKSDRYTLPYTVCSAPAEDNDVMDASTLMSPDYVQPLIPSELGILVQHVFDPDNIACLRHLAAKKLVHAQGPQMFSMIPTVPNLTTATLDHRRPTSPTSPTSLGRTPQSLVPHHSAVSPYLQAKISDHTQQQEKLVQIRLAKWAGDLQRSLQNERARYEAIARGERAVWLKDRLGETINDGALVHVQESAAGASPEKGAVPKIPEAGRIPGHCGLLDAGDPLGLLRWNEALRRRGWIAFQVVGSFGIFGAVAVWVVRTWGSDGYTTWNWAWPGTRI